MGVGVIFDSHIWLIKIKIIGYERFDSLIKFLPVTNGPLTKPIIIKDYLKDHRVFMMSTIAALTLGGKWKIHDKDSINTSFPSFLKIVKDISN